VQTRRELLRNLDKAIQRMEQKGLMFITRDGINHYEELKRKRELIAAGCKYEIRDMTKEIFATFGGLLCNANHLGTGGKIYTLKEIIETAKKQAQEF